MTSERKKRIFFITGTMARGGAERVISVLSGYFAQKAFDVRIITLLKGVCEYELDNGVSFVDLSDKSTGFIGILKTLKRLKKYFKSEKPDAVVSFMAKINVITHFALKEKDKIHTVMCERNDPLKDGRNVLLKFFVSNAYSKSDVAVFQTEYAKGAFNKVCANNAKVIPNPVFVSELAKDNGEHIIVSAGRFVPQKNHKMLIDAFAGFHEKFPQYKLKIFGFGPLKDALKKQVAELNLESSIFILDSTPELHKEMAQAEFFVMSSNYEGLSNVVLEAMCMGLPVISTDCSGISEYINNGENGFLTPCGDTKALCVSMEKLAEDEMLRKKIGQNALGIKEKVSGKAVLDKWDEAVLIRNTEK